MWNYFKDRIDRLHSSVQNMLSRGSLNSITNGKTAKAQVQLMADETYDGIEYPQDYGFISSPPSGSQVITGHFAGDRDHATILKAFHTQYAPKVLASGEVALYHMSGSIILFKQDGSIDLTPNNGTVSITGNLIVSGDITDKKSSMQQMRDDYNPHTHGGGSPPIPQMT